ncbi:MAG: transaldolase, partial [SAR202 cluster bacterium]|nr:transaldolase [SAR202 cluster bacterium]
MTNNPLRELHNIGQSFWYDSLSRDMIVNGDLKKMVEEDGLRGITSNPTIFQQAIAKSSLYDGLIEHEARKGKTKEQIFDLIAQQDIRGACDILRPVYDASGGADGFVSLEESPLIAHDLEASISEGYRLKELVGRPNLLVKVPATPAGIKATKELLVNGVSVNNTLMFSIANYDATAETYIAALEERAERGLPLDAVASVASMFVSRIDSKIDGWIDRMLKSEKDTMRRQSLQVLRGKVAIANGKQCYLHYKQFFHSARFKKLAARGARPQRVLTASTS